MNSVASARLSLGAHLSEKVAVRFCKDPKDAPTTARSPTAAARQAGSQGGGGELKGE